MILDEAENGFDATQSHLER